MQVFVPESIASVADKATSCVKVFRILVQRRQRMLIGKKETWHNGHFSV